jgi:tRNA C32,U32 (ribose-2'-O)-methylase TrmJ
LAATLQIASASGWNVLGTDSSTNAATLQGRASGPTVLVMGNEGAGLRTNVKRACTSLVKVSMGGAADAAVLDSLNVSVAAGVMLHTLTQGPGAAQSDNDESSAVDGGSSGRWQWGAQGRGEATQIHTEAAVTHEL